MPEVSISPNHAGVRSPLRYGERNFQNWQTLPGNWWLYRAIYFSRWPVSRASASAGEATWGSRGEVNSPGGVSIACIERPGIL